MAFFFFVALFIVLLGAGVYNEKIEGRDALAWLVGVGVLFALFFRAGWSIFGFMAILLVINAYLILHIFERDIWVPPWSGGA